MESNYKKLICAISVIAIIVVIIQINGLYGLVTENIAYNFTRNNNSEIGNSDESNPKTSNDTIIKTVRQIELPL